MPKKQSGNEKKMGDSPANDAAPETKQPSGGKKGGRGVLTEKMIAAQWKPGQSGNPGGKNNKPLTGLLMAQLTSKVPNDPEKRSYAQLLIEASLKRAISKSDALVKEIFDRVEGRLAVSEDQKQNEATVRVVILDAPRPNRAALIDVAPAKTDGDD